MEDPEFRGAYERSMREIEQTDQVIRELDALRVDLGMSKAELARRINRNASSPSEKRCNPISQHDCRRSAAGVE